MTENSAELDDVSINNDQNDTRAPIPSAAEIADDLANEGFDNFNPKHFFHSYSFGDRKAGQWFKWETTHWAEIHKDLFCRELMVILQDAYPTDRFKSSHVVVWTFLDGLERHLRPLLQGHPMGFTEESNKFQLDAEFYLSFKNCHINLKSYKVVELTPDIKNTAFLDFDYDPEAVAPRFLEYLKYQHGDTYDYEFNQLAFGSILCPDIRDKNIYQLTDAMETEEGNTGKSFLLQYAIYQTLEPYTQEIDWDWLCGRGSNHEFGDFNIKYLYFVDEIGNDPISNNRLKSLSGNPTRRVNPKFKQQFNILNVAKLFIASNTLIRIIGGDAATWKRIVPLRYGEPIPDGEQDKTNFYGKEKSGIINYLLDGAKMFRKLEGRVVIPESSKAILDEAKHESRDYGDFIDDCIEFDPDGKFTNKDLLNAFAKWVETVSNKPSLDNIRVFKWRIGNNLKQVGLVKTNCKRLGRGWRGGNIKKSLYQTKLDDLRKKTNDSL